MKICCFCGENFPDKSMINGINHRSVCKSCASRSIKCPCCGIFYPVYNTFDLSNCDGKLICPKCRDYILDAQLNKYPIKKYYYKPVPKFLTASQQKVNPNTLFFGLEIEQDRGSNKAETAQLLTNHHDWLYLKRDSSLDNGFEIVTHPMTIEAFNEHEQEFKSMFETLSDNGFRSRTVSSCGTHIHVSRSPLSDTAITNLIYWISKFKNFWRAHSNRVNMYKLDEYAEFPVLSDYEEAQQMLESSKTKTMNRHVALNIMPNNTIEFRWYQGVSSWEKLHDYVNTINNLVQHAMVCNQTQAEDIEVLELINPI